MSQQTGNHLDSERIQAFLDGDVSNRERRRIEAHVASCTRCAEEMATWRVLFDDLDALPTHEPKTSFTEHVLAGVDVEPPLPWAARVRAALTGLLPGGKPEHLDDAVLQDFVDGTLPARLTARVEAHVSTCRSCADEALRWRGTFDRLSGLEPLEVSEGFADRVMAGLAARASVAVEGPARAPAWRRALSRAGRLVPRTRKAWAALGGIAVTPAVTFGLIVYAVFSHPTLTPGALASYATWRLTDLLVSAWTVALTAALDGVRLVGLDSVVEAMLATPALTVGGLMAYSVLCALALRVLYKNLFGARSARNRHARLSTP